MRKFAVMIGVLFALVAVAAAQHANSNEAAVKGTLTVNKDVMLGTEILRSGVYKYQCDREFITFSNPDTKRIALKVPCEGRELPAPATETAMETKTDASGKTVVTKLLLKGSNVEHVFK